MPDSQSQPQRHAAARPSEGTDTAQNKKRALKSELESLPSNPRWPMDNILEQKYSKKYSKEGNSSHLLTMPYDEPARAKMELYPMVKWKYDLFLYVLGNLVDLFFREVVPRGSWRVPQSGPVLFVAAPHANQFVDALILQRTLRHEAGRRVSLLIAQKSVHGFIGWGSRQVGSVPVGRAQDAARPAAGKIYLPDPIGDPTLVRGVGTRFDGEGEPQGMLFLPAGKGTTGASVDIASIAGPEELRVKRPFKGAVAMRQLTGRDD
ncbi:glycerol-3-phosphate O-acyltransferase, partial [Tolypocladium paradoxum]